MEQKKRCTGIKKCQKLKLKLVKNQFFGEYPVKKYPGLKPNNINFIEQILLFDTWY